MKDPQVSQDHRGLLAQRDQQALQDPGEILVNWVPQDVLVLLGLMGFQVLQDRY